MPKYDQLLSDRYSDTVFLIWQITKQHLVFKHARNHINEQPNMVNDTLLIQKRGIFSAIFNFLFRPSESQNL